MSQPYPEDVRLAVPSLPRREQARATASVPLVTAESPSVQEQEQVEVEVRSLAIAELASVAQRFVILSVAVELVETPMMVAQLAES